MWECSECSGQVPGASAPTVCPECGIAGAIFSSVDPDDPLMADSDGDGLRATWLRAGIERADVFART